MKVTLLYATPGAMDLLIFTKNTRLKMGPETMDEIKSWPQEKKLKELEYMSTTVPSSWEFIDLIFCVEGVSRAFTHQMVRTRTASYAQQAMRVNVMENFDYVTGPSIGQKHASDAYHDTMGSIQSGYDALIAAGVNSEDARGVLPTNICTNICAKYNLRAFADLVKKRSGGRTQSEYAEVVEKMKELVIAEWPWSAMFFDNRKGDALKKLDDYFKVTMQAEIKRGIQMHETASWAYLKAIDILRNE